MNQIITIINQKGGVGKSTTAQALGTGLILKGYKVLFIDLDGQGNLSYTMKTSPDYGTIYDLLTGSINILEAIQSTENGDIIASSGALAGADTIITEIGKEYRLKEALTPIKEMYDYIIIDTPPALGVLTINALTASTGAIITAQADIYSLQGISQLNNTIKIVKQYCNPTLKVKGILLTRYSPRAILSRDMAEIIDQTATQLNTELFNTKIRECIAIKEAQASQQSIFKYAPKSNAAIDYTAFINEILKEEL